MEEGGLSRRRMEEKKKRRAAKEGLNHVGGEIGRRIKVRDLLNVNKHAHVHTKARTHAHMHVIFTPLTVEFRWSNPNYYN